MYEEFNVCLLAVSGDCSKYGMSNKPTFIPIDPNRPTYNLIKKFLRNQTESDLFLYKYHVRTNWVLEELENGKPLTETDAELSEGY